MQRTAAVLLALALLITPKVMGQAHLTPVIPFEASATIVPPWMYWLFGILGAPGAMACIACVFLWLAWGKERDRNDKLSQVLLEVTRANTMAMTDLATLIRERERRA